MAGNKVQFHKGLSLGDFLKDYGTEEQRFNALSKWRWPEGFGFALCHHDKYCQLKNPKLFQCNRCHHQTPVSAGTIFESTKLALTTWLQGIYFVTQDKKGISAMELHRHLGISYNGAWRMKQKLMQVMMERDTINPCWGSLKWTMPIMGGERTGCKPGRGAEGKTPFVAAVEATNEGQPSRIKLKY